MVLESVNAVQDTFDREAARFAIDGHDGELSYTRHLPHEEPMLWVADALSWATTRRESVPVRWLPGP